ncbi:MAG TPA: ABC transporter substrate-binding protein [Burkholderiaceae bacterium]|jgi:branched-chain amino acid transport system substrate-binding protein|nr:ABC transporter substrate-binding protein [Burkholderiaceae bacterium]
MKSWLVAATAAVSIGIATGAAAQSAPIRIGLSGAFTGPAALASEWEKWGVDLAVEEINAAGGLLGRRVEIVQVDNRCNPTEGANSARKLVQERVSAIIGAHCSSATLAMMPIIQEAKIPMVTGVSSSPKIGEASGAGGNPFMFRISPDDLRMARALTEYLGKNRLFKNIAIIAEDSDFGRGGAGAFTPLAQKAGMTIVSTDFAPQMTPDFTTLLTRVAQRRPDAIALFMLSADQMNLTRTALQMGLKIPYTGRAELAGKMLEIIAAGGMEGSVSAWTYSPAIDNPQNKKFADTINNRYKTQATLQSWAGYDSMRVLAQAIREAGSDEPTKIRDALAKVKFTTLHGKPTWFDANNEAGRIVVLQSVKDRKVVVLDLYELQPSN